MNCNLIDRFSVARILLLVFGFLVSGACDRQSEKNKAFDFLYNNEWDSFKLYLGSPVHPYFDFIIKKSLKFRNNYSFVISDDKLIVQVETESTPDTISFFWDNKTQKIEIDSIELHKLFSNEVYIREELSKHYAELGSYQTALQWLVYPDSIIADHLYGLIYFKQSDLGTAFPFLERAYLSGDEISGLYLSDIYTLAGNRDQAIKLLKELGSSNNSEAMVKLGEYYETYFSEFGYSPPVDATNISSFLWYKRAADLNNSFAMYKLGFIYEEGINKDINIDSAFYWYLKSSRLGECAATVEIARFYLEGNYIKHNLDSGLFWMEKAVRQDARSGYYELGEIFDKGVGVDVNKNLALKFYLKADSLGYPVVASKIRRLKNIESDL